MQKKCQRPQKNPKKDFGKHHKAFKCSFSMFLTVEPLKTYVSKNKKRISLITKQQVIENRKFSSLANSQ